jgi:hypothetical protein
VVLPADARRVRLCPDTRSGQQGSPWIRALAQIAPPPPGVSTNPTASSSPPLRCYSASVDPSLLKPNVAASLPQLAAVRRSSVASAIHRSNWAPWMLHGRGHADQSMTEAARARSAHPRTGKGSAVTHVGNGRVDALEGKARELSQQPTVDPPGPRSDPESMGRLPRT